MMPGNERWSMMPGNKRSSMMPGNEVKHDAW